MRDDPVRGREENRIVLPAGYGHGLHASAGHAFGDASRYVCTSVGDGALDCFVFRSGRNGSALPSPFVFHADFAGRLIER